MNDDGYWPDYAIYEVDEADGMNEHTSALPTPYQSGMFKPCPFCGADSSNLEVKGDEFGPFIYCACCDAVYTIPNGTTGQIVKGWNRRARE